MTAKPWAVTAAVLTAAVGLSAIGVGLAGDPPKEDWIPAVDRREPDRKPLKPPADGWTVTVHPAKCETKNFMVTADDAVVARAVANEAEHQRKAAAERWLGKELPAWDTPCPIAVKISPTKTGGATTFTFASGDKPPAVNAIEMTLFGSLEKLLQAQVPHEVTHTVLATHFGKPLPRWADEGIALTAESVGEQAAHDAKVREMLNDGRGIPLRKLLPMTEYPKDVLVLYAQGHSVVRFLLSRKLRMKVSDEERKKATPERVFITFVAMGMSVSWDEAAATVYGFADLDEMQEAWLEWLRKPDSSLADALTPPKPKPTDDKFIPPTRLGK